MNDYALRWGFEHAYTRAEIAFGETVPGGIIWHDLRRPLQPDFERTAFTSTTLVISWATQGQVSRQSTLAQRGSCWNKLLRS